MAAKSVRVRGVTYQNPDEARVAADEIAHHAETVASNLRRDGKHAQADTVSDSGLTDAGRLRGWARDREAEEAAHTPQPADTPPASLPSSPARRKASKRTRARPRSRTGKGSRPRLTPQARRIVAQTGVPGATSTATSLALQVAGMTMGIAFLTILLTSGGVTAFASLTGSLSNALSWIVNPVDPLAPRPKPAPAATASSAAATAAANAVARSLSSPARLTTVPLTGVG